MKKFFGEFKAFIMRGNVLDMAVGVIVGGAFTAIVAALTANFLQPLLDWILGAWDAKYVVDGVCTWTFGGAVAAFLTAVATFVLTAFVLFVIIKFINKLMTIGKKPEEPAAPEEPTTKVCPFCQSEISINATRCPHCTSVLEEQK